MKQKQTARQVLEAIAAFPLRKDHERDERGEIKHGSSTYSEGYAAYRMQQMAKEWVASNTRARSAFR